MAFRARTGSGIKIGECSSTEKLYVANAVQAPAASQSRVLVKLENGIMSSQLSFVITFVAGCAFVSAASASVIQTNEIGASRTGFAVSATDLINAGGSTLDHVDWPGYVEIWGSVTTGGNDGVAGTGFMDIVPLDNSANSPDPNTSMIAYLKGSAAGYDIGGIDTFAAWGDSRVNQSYKVYYLQAGETYSGAGNLPHQLGAADFAYAPGAAGDAQTRVSLRDTTGVLAANVTAIQFRFTGSYVSAYQEFDVLGHASVPEPGAIAMLGAGLIGILAYAWRRRG